ncbi:MAG: hypothetical protein ERJ69_06420 [Aphanocapsa feldmannii 288cV]|nr:MAG: hypothetical protein ERJ69_06420 [Aphanocapsa feldmannii 288cV]
MKLPIKLALALILLTSKIKYMSKSLLLFATLLLVAAPAIADSCNKPDRVHANDSYCLEADHSNKNFPWRKASASAKNKCSQFGKMIVKVDRTAASDWTWHLENSDKRKKSGTAKIRGVYCCDDLGPRNICTWEPGDPDPVDRIYIDGDLDIPVGFG